MITNPHMLPKVRSEALMAACEGQPCSMRIASFGGIPCAPNNTCVGCHPPIFGKGMSTKVTDLSIMIGCATCHDLLDWERNPMGERIRREYAQAFWTQLFKAQNETQARFVQMGLIVVPGAELI